MKETWTRAAVKALTYRVWQSVNTFIISLLVTGEVAMAAAIVSIEIVVKLVIYVAHERIWNRLKWGKF